MTNTETLISKVWSFADVLRDDDVSYGDYLEQLTYLLFLKLADEYTKPPYNRKLPIPDGYNWESMLSKRGAELDFHYVKLLRELGKASGILGLIFTKSQKKLEKNAEEKENLVYNPYTSRILDRKSVKPCIRCNDPNSTNTLI